MSGPFVKFILHYGSKFIGESEYCGGEKNEYPFYNLQWAYDDFDEILENFGYPKTVKVGVLVGEKTFKFLGEDEQEWRQYLELVVDKKTNFANLYVEALAEDEEERMVVVETEKGGVVEATKIAEEKEKEIRVESEVEEIVIEEQDVATTDWGLECNEDDKMPDGDVDFDEEHLIIEESEPEHDLEDCDFSDNEEEVLEARQKIRERRLRRNIKCATNSVYANNCKEKDFQFQLGMRFADRKEVKEAVIMWNVLNGHNIK